MLAQIQWYSVLKSTVSPNTMVFSIQIYRRKIILKVDGKLSNWPNRGKEYNPFRSNKKCNPFMRKPNQSLLKALFFRESNGKFYPTTRFLITIYEIVDNRKSHLQ